MKISLFCLLALLLSLPRAFAQSAPGDEQNAEAERDKILKAADQLDMIQGNTESTKVEVEAMKSDVAKLQDENTALKQQLSDLQAAFDKSEADRAKERQVLLDEVAKMVASGKSPSVAAAKKKMTPPPAEADTEAIPADSAPATPAPETAPAPAPVSPTDAASNPPPAPPPKPQKGYYHVVEEGETLTMIVTAYRQQGVHVTMAQVRKANDLTEKSILKIGQKLFIPKPGA